jgi:surface protein
MNEYTTDRGGLTTKIGPIKGSNEMEINFYAWAGEDSFGGVDLTVTVKDVVNETPFAVWSEADKTLYFGRGDMPVVGNTYTTESGEEVTVTNMWYGEDVTQTPSDAWNAWNSPIAPYCERVVFQPSFATVRPTTLSSWFYQFKALTTLEGMEYLNTSEVTDMSHMFQMCSALTELDLTRFNTEKVTSMTAIFGECSALKTIYCNDTWTCEGWASGNMFYKCNNLVGAISYDINCTGVAYANPDTGYFTRKFLPGDANGDGSVSITDVGLVIDYILGKNPANIVVEAANVNNDSSVSITDVGLIIDIILHQGSHAVKQHGQRMFKTLFPLDYEPQ